MVAYCSATQAFVKKFIKPTWNETLILGFLPWQESRSTNADVVDWWKVAFPLFAKIYSNFLDSKLNGWGDWDIKRKTNNSSTKFDLFDFNIERSFNVWRDSLYFCRESVIQCERDPWIYHVTREIVLFLSSCDIVDAIFLERTEIRLKYGVSTALESTQNVVSSATFL